MLEATIVIIAAIGLLLLAGGAWLAALGGSLFYLIAGLLLLATAYLLWRRRGLALWLYAGFLLATLGWALAEVGLDWWQLAPRGGIFVLLGLWLALPWIGRRLDDARAGLRGAATAGRVPARLALRLVLAVTVATAIVSMFLDPHDLEGQLALATPEEGAEEGAGEGMPADSEWLHYGNTLAGQRYSPLGQIDRGNIGALDVAWTYRTGDVRLPEDVAETTYQATPLKVGDLLYICTPHNLAIALDAVTGEERWRFDAQSGMNPSRQHQTCRGLTYWADPAAGADAPCAARVYMPTADARLIALDAATGATCPEFGREGTVDLTTGMQHNPDGYYYSTSPPAAVGDKLIIGGAVNDNYSIWSQSGVIRGYDAKTGTLVWKWDSGNPDDTEPLGPGETYTANSPNSWSVFSADAELGLVYIPLGNQVPDQLGMGRSEHVERFSSSIVALETETGRLRWVVQTVHHDLWDMDVPAQPVLLDLTLEDGETVPALVGPTKQGDIYVLDRATGAPLHPIQEVPAPSGTIPEDFAAATQPISAVTFSPDALRERDMWGLTIFDQLLCRIDFHRLRYEGRYTPPSVEGTIVYPGNFGVFNWGSVAVDPEAQVMFGMPTYLAFTSRLVPRAEIPPPEAGAKGSEQGLNRNEGSPYGVFMGPFLGVLGIPCQAPPWGYVAGVDLRSGETVYRHRNGTVYDMTPLPLPFELGVPGIGGPMITGGGIAFLAATVDNYLRAYDLATGETIWRARLPAGGQATPMTYTAGGRQYVVIVAGGHGSIGTKAGDYVIAYALRDPE